MSNGFTGRWRAVAWHLTYKDHIPAFLLLAALAAITRTKVILTSIVHEASSAEVPYNHTHFAWLWEKGVDLMGCRIMDILWNGATFHPNILYKKNLCWLQLIVEKYHHGYKMQPSGKLEFTEPVAGPFQDIPPGFEWNGLILKDVSNAPDLLSGVQAAGLYPKSVSDVLLLQKHKRPARFEHNYPPSQFKPIGLPPNYLSGKVGALHVYGAVCLGKTEWALAQFENPLLVRSKDALREFLPGHHDGIVIDTMVFNNWTLAECEALTDYTQPSRIACRYGDAKIPKKTRKIIVTNARDIWPHDPHGQLLGRRVSRIQIISPLF